MPHEKPQQPPLDKITLDDLKALGEAPPKLPIITSVYGPKDAPDIDRIVGHPPKAE